MVDGSRNYRGRLGLVTPRNLHHHGHRHENHEWLIVRPDPMPRTALAIQNEIYHLMLYFVARGPPIPGMPGPVFPSGLMINLPPTFLVPTVLPPPSQAVALFPASFSHLTLPPLTLPPAQAHALAQALLPALALATAPAPTAIPMTVAGAPPGVTINEEVPDEEVLNETVAANPSPQEGMEF